MQDLGIKRLIGVLALAQLTAVMACGGSSAGTQPSPGASGPPDKITIQEDFGTNGKHASLWLAKEKGIFAKHNLEVTLVPGNGAGNALQALIGGKADFALSSFIEEVLARSKGGATKSVLLMYPESPMAMCSLQNRLDLKTPKDLEGHTVGVAAGTSFQAILPVLMSKNSVDPAKVKILNTAANLYVQSLIQKQIDVGPCFINESYQVLLSKAKEANLPISQLKFRDFNVDVLDLFLAATDDMIKNKPELVRRVVASIVEASQYMQAHPDDAVSAVMQANPQLDQTVTSNQVKATLQLQEGFKKTGFGTADPAKVQSTIQILTTAYNLTTTVSPNDVYTSSFLPKK
jgi:NitT/TauT family transport system substrate-binding protein